MQDTVKTFGTLDGRSRAKQEFLRYRADILALGYFPEYKIARFWRANLSVQDIRDKKDVELWPPREKAKNLWEPEEYEMLVEQRKGYRALSMKQLQKRLLKAMIKETERIGKTHRLRVEERNYLIATRIDLLARYKALDGRQ